MSDMATDSRICYYVNEEGVQIGGNVLHSDVLFTAIYPAKHIEIKN